jgi:hypothetical protein
MQKIIIALLIGVFFVQYTFADSFSETDCTEKNFENRFGPMIYQGDNNYCWAFAAAQLVEDHLCRMNPSACGKSISRLDVSACTFKLGNEKSQQVGHTEEALTCALEQGVCEEQYAPYDLANGKLKCDGDKNCTLQNLISYYKDKNSEGIRAEKTYDVDVLESMKQASDVNDFLKRTLIPPNCTKRRIPLRFRDENYSVLKTLYGLEPEDFANKKEAILTAFNENRSWTAGICLERWSNPGLKGIKMQQCDRHAVVVDGMTWNKEKNQCQLHVRNSIPTSHISNWVEADHFVNTIFSIIRFSDLPNEKDLSTRVANSLGSVKN